MNFSPLPLENIRGKKVLVRVDWNVPLENGRVRDDFRIKYSLPTIQELSHAGARVILASHLESKETDSLKSVHAHANNLFPLQFVEDIVGDRAKEAVEKLGEGEVLLLENLRRDPREKENGDDFSRALASLADIYINEAFSASHRNHASITGVPTIIPGYAGRGLAREVSNLSKAFNPPHPFLFILGGAKFDTKLPLLQKFITLADTIFVGGALAHNFFKEEGRNLGDSLVSEGDFHLSELRETNRVLLPVDAQIKSHDGIGNDSIDSVGAGDVIVDAGPETLELLKEKVNESAFILWNGPLGNYEQGFKTGTQTLATILAESGKETVLGGADTLAAIEELGIAEKFTFVSSGGGAMLDFLANETLPGLEVLRK